MWNEKKITLDDVISKIHKIIIGWSFKLKRHYAWFALFLAFFIGYFLGSDKHTASSIISRVINLGEHTQLKRKEPTHVPEENIEEEYGLSISELLGLAELSRRRLKEQMKKEFGMISTPFLNLDDFFRMKDESRERLLRRLMVKVLAAQLDEFKLGKEHSTFTWVTAGDSVAAAHGNLFEQSYTAVLEETVKDTFATMGINFVAKNRGIGGYGSGPELAFCLESVYGSDIDILSWDFGIMDRNLDSKILLWGNRAGIHPTKPIMMMIDDRANRRWADFDSFVSSGMGTVLMDSQSLQRTMIREIHDMNIPESKFLSDPVKYLICNGHVEGNVPCDNEATNYMCEVENSGVCLVNKFHTRESCEFSRYQDSWNPGMKLHFLRGRLIGLFILELLNDALLAIDALKHPSSFSNKPTDNYSLFQNLQSEERNDELLFHKSKPRVGDWSEKRYKETLFELNPSKIFRAHSICHTALLPSEIRYSGILSPNFHRIRRDGEGYDLGQSSGAYVVNSGQVPLIYDPSERQECNLLNIDFKDYFLVPPTTDWLSITLPSAKETEVYGKQVTQREGIILICSKKCEGNCPHGSGSFEWDTNIKNNNIEIEVDNEKVTGAKEWDGCFFLKGNHGLKWGTEQRQQFEIKFKMHANEMELKISSLIIF